LRDLLPDIAAWKVVLAVVPALLLVAGIVALALGLGADEEPANRGVATVRDAPGGRGSQTAGRGERRAGGANAGAQVRALAKRMSIEDRVARLHAEAERQGRDPATLSITIADGRADLDAMRSLEAEGIDRVLLSVPPGDRDATLRVLESHGAVARAAA